MVATRVQSLELLATTALYSVEKGVGVMSEKTAELWARAGEREKSPEEAEAALAELNRKIDWDRKNLTSDAPDERESVPADD